MDEPSTVLVVDEDPSIRDVLVQKLEALGYRTLEARNGREALDQVALAAAGSRPARRHDAGDGRLPGLPAAQGR